MYNWEIYTVGLWDFMNYISKCWAMVQMCLFDNAIDDHHVLRLKGDYEKAAKIKKETDALFMKHLGLTFP